MLIERALPYQLGASTTYVMGADGVRCSIAVPVSTRTTAEETGHEPDPLRDRRILAIEDE